MMQEANYITATCSIKNGNVSVDGKNVFSDSENNIPVEFFKLIYTHYQLKYPKFYKMDSLCKLAFLASELVLKSNNITEKYKQEDIGIVIANSASSLEIDTEYQNTISDKENYFPSPSIFVYTLPNILIGEIAIRNKIKGENAFFIFDKFESNFMSKYVYSMMNNNQIQCCITGWVDCFENNYEAFLYIVEKNNNNILIEHTHEQLNKLYNNNR